MKKFSSSLIAFVLLFFMMPLLQSCLKDWDNKYDTLFAVGTVKIIEGNDYYFALDEGSKLYPSDTTRIHNYALVDGQRAFVYFSKQETPLSGYEYNAKLEHIENILTKNIYSMQAEEADSIGDDRVNATDLWITGDYLNIKYQIYHSNIKEKPHMLSLVINEASTGEYDKPGYLTLEFRHNAFDDSSVYLSPGVASFKLSSLGDLLKDKKGMNIRVNSIYDGQKYLIIDLKKEEQ